MSPLPVTHAPLARPHPFGGRPAGLGRLTAVELRKTLDTRAARWLLLVTAVVTAGGLGYPLLRADGVVAYRDVLHLALSGVQPVLPVVAVLAMTSEWTQRTGLTTFALVPRRGRVLAAKLNAVVALAVGAVLAVAVLAAAASWAAGAATGVPVEWGDAPRGVAGAVVASVLAALMGAAVGALLQQTPVALAAYLVAPPLVIGAATALLREDARWVDVFRALEGAAELETDAGAGGLLVPLVVWVVLPLLAGTVRYLRRDLA